MRIGQHQHQVIHRLGIHRDVCRIAVAFGCIVEYHGILAIVMHEVACIFHILVGVVIKRIRVHHAVIRTIETLHTRMQQFRSCHVFSISALDGGQLIVLPFVGVLDIDVVDGNGIHILRKHELSRHGQGERYGYLIVHRDRRLPHLRHLEVLSHTGNLASRHVFLNRGREVELVDYLVHVRNHATCQLVQTGIMAHHLSIVILGLKGNGVLYHRSIGRHIGEENQRQTSGKHTRTSTYFQRLVLEHVPNETYTGRNLPSGIRPLASVDVLPVEVKLIDGIVSLEVVVVEHQVVETDTVGQFQTVAEVPFILGIETKLVEGNLSIGVGHTVEAISQSE